MFLVQVLIFLLKWNSSLGCFDLFVEHSGDDEDGLESRANAFVKKRPMVPATTLQVLYVCCEESEERFGELCGDRGMKIVAEIVRTASAGCLKNS
ncbi:hypothetical protein AAC387_Pa06g2171 [Persea americana]